MTRCAAGTGDTPLPVASASGSGDELVVVVRIALDACGRPVGTLRHGDRPPVPVTGWLALLGGLSAAASETAPPGARSGDHSTGADRPDDAAVR